MTQGGIGVGVIGLGFIGQTHIAAYLAADPLGRRSRVAAVCDRRRERLSGVEPGMARAAPGPGRMGPGNPAGLGSALEPAVADAIRRARSYRDPGDLLADPAVALVSICTYTDTHVDLACAALRSGKHVLVEKPVALCARDVAPLVDAARGARTLCMPAMCMRFWPAWARLRAIVAEGRAGAVRSAVFRRFGAMPAWNDFYRDYERSGGALVDLHIHDADFVLWCFGRPDAVSARGTLKHVSTEYHYSGRPGRVVAEGGWHDDPARPFEMRFAVEFEHGRADFELGREPQFRATIAGRRSEMRAPSVSAYALQAAAALGAVLGEGAAPLALDDARDVGWLPHAGVTAPAADRTVSPIPLEDAVAVAVLLDAERASLETGRDVPVC
jgi:predicted dehydrogenase